MIHFTAIYPTAKNFTPADLMRDHARLTRGEEYRIDEFFTPYIFYAGTRYYYDHWKIENGSDANYICVTVYLKEKAA